MYVDDIRAQVAASIVRIALFGVAGFLVIALLSWWVVRGIMRPVREASETLERVADGDLTPRLEVRTHDELGDLRRAVNHTLDEITGALSAVHESTFTLAGAAEELTATSGELARSASSTTDASQRAQELIGLVGASAGEATTVADRAAAVTADMNVTITDLGASSLEIGDVVSVITSIAEQTNLLALNATIEAARAGQAGRGFAVVADEVKQLARQTTDATHEIRTRVEGIQSVTSQAVDAIALVSETIGQIDRIQSQIAEHVDGAGTGDGITSHIGDLRNSAERTSSASQGTLEAANELTQLASRLSTHLARFRFEPRTSGLVGAGRL